MPAEARMTGASSLRMSAASTAADAVREEHQQFRLAAADVPMTEHHALYHVSAVSEPTNVGFARLLASCTAV